MLQTIIWGIEHLKNIPPIKEGKRLLVVSDNSFPLLPIHESIMTSLCEYTFFCDFGSNPLYEDVCKGVELYHRNNCEAILAIGGGSSIDVAKCIKLFSNMEPSSCFLKEKFRDSPIPLLAIPTTAGTGSESTHFAVIYYNGAKQSISHSCILPNYAILEPSVLTTLPIYQKKCTFLDALCQGIESWWSVNSTPQSIKLSCYAVRTLIDNLDGYLIKNERSSARNVMDAANRAGQAINITQTTAPHAFSYKLTSLYGIPHGHAVAVCLPEIWLYMLQHEENCIDSRGFGYLNNIFHDIAAALHQPTPRDAINFFKQILNQLNIEQPQSLSKTTDIDILVHSVNPDRLKNNPISLNPTAINDIYNSILL